MTEAKVLALESLQLEEIHELIRSPGPCVTLLLPPYRPGEQAKPMATVMKSDLQEAARQLAQRGIPDSITRDLLEPLEHPSTHAAQTPRAAKTLTRLHGDETAIFPY